MYRTLYIALVAALTTAVFAGCARDQRSTETQPPAPYTTSPEYIPEEQPLAQQPLEGEEQRLCPMIDARVNVTTEETIDGAALVFTTDEGDVTALRQEVGQIATLINQTPTGRMGQGQGMHGQGMHGQGMHGQGMQGQGMGMMRGWQLMDASATVEEVEDGARLILTPRDPQRLEQLRYQAQQHASDMSMTCPMVQSQPRAS